MAAELIAATRGLGFMVQSAGEFLATDVVLAGIAVIAIIAFLLELGAIIVMIAIVITAGTNTPDTLSAIFAMSAFVAAASETICIICESVVSSPTLVARHFIKPDWFTVAALTASFGCLSTGMLSPVSAVR